MVPSVSRTRRLIGSALLVSLSVPGLAVGLPAATPPGIAYVAQRIPATTPAISLSDALARIRAQAGLPDLISVEQGQPQEPAPPNSPLPWLNIAIRAPSIGDGGDVRALWEADLVLGAVADLAGTAPSNLENASGASVAKSLSAGGIATELVPIGAVANRQAFSNEPSSAIIARVRDVAATFGLEVVDVQVLRAYQAAPLVVLRARDRSVLGELAEIAKALFGVPPLYEGHYLEVQDSAGKPLVRLAAAFRVGADRTWNDPSVTDISGIQHAGPPQSGVVTNVGVEGLRWRTRRGARQGLIARVHVSSAGALTVIARRDGKVVARGATVFGRGGGRRDVRLRLQAPARAVARAARKGHLDVSFVMQQAAGGATGVWSRMMPGRTRT